MTNHRLAVTYIYLVLTLTLAFAVTYLLALARVPQIEAGFWAFAYGLGWRAASPSVVRWIGRRVRGVW